MRKLMLVLSAIMLTSTLAFAGEEKAPAGAPAKASAKKAHKKMSKMMGAVDAVDAATNTVTIKDGKGVVSKCVLSADTKIRKGGKAVAIGDLAVGDKVMCTCEGEGDALKCVSLIVKGAKK